jgi:soluble P-type ATPase
VIAINVPGGTRLRRRHQILDYNGTLACDGALIPGVAERLTFLA